MAESLPTGANPYVGPRTFMREDGERFFGREREARELLSLVISQRLVLFYAQSGAGKSSLLNTRLAPNLEDAGFAVLPVARVGGELPPGVAAVDNIYLFNLMLSLDQAGRDPGRLAQVRLVDFLARLTSDDRERYYYDETLPADAGIAAEVSPGPGLSAAGEEYAEPNYVLIVDQFEEFFTTHPARWQERAAFFAQLDKAMRGDRRLWVVLTLREDYVAALDPYAPLMSDKLRARYYMQRMEIAAALDAIRRPAELGGRPFAAGVAEKLTDDLCQVRVPGQEATVAGQHIEPVQLQVVCYQLWERLQRGIGGTQISEADLAAAGEVNQALEQFYAETLAAVLAEPAVSAAGVSERALRTWFDQELITETGIRNTVFRNEAAGRTGTLANGAVDALGRRFLLRTELRGGGAWVELVHDRLVEPIRANNATWFPQHLSTLQRQAALWKDRGRPAGLLLQSQALAEAEVWAAAHENELEPHERDFLEACRQARAAADRERRQSRIIRGLGAVAMGVALIALVLALVAVNSARRANKAETTANDARATAVAEADRAASFAATAVAEADRARNSEAAADSAKTTAVTEAQRAEDRTELAKLMLAVQADFLAQLKDRRLTHSMLDRQSQRLAQGRAILESKTVPQGTKAPNMVGMHYTDAEQKLNQACEQEPCVHLQYKWKMSSEQPSGSVLRSDPPAGEEILWGAPVTLTLSQGAPVTIAQPISMVLVPIPSGEFSMGSDIWADANSDLDERPQHTVNLPEYYIGKYEVTNAQYATFVGATFRVSPTDWEDPFMPPAGMEDHPVVNVSWNDGVAFTQWLTEETGKAFRLCTEAEWEKACRGTDGLIYPWGDSFDASKANRWEVDWGTLGTRPGTIVPVGTYSPAGDSPYGVSDMTGNVWEWTSSMYKDYPYDPTDGREDATSTDGAVVRGGWFKIDNLWGAKDARCAMRNFANMKGGLPFFGLRVCVSPTR